MGWMGAESFTNSAKESIMTAVLWFIFPDWDPGLTQSAAGSAGHAHAREFCFFRLVLTMEIFQM